MTPATIALCAQVRAAIVRKGWSETARLVGMNRAALHRAFPEGRKPHRGMNLTTLDLVLKSIGMQLSLTRAEPPPPPAGLPAAARRDLTHCPDFDGGYDR